MGRADGPAADEPSDRHLVRGGGSRLKLWLLLDANRWAVVGALAAVFLAALLAFGAADPTAFRSDVASGDPIETLFQALVTAIVTGVTLVVTINQLVLSQELGAVGDQRERMEAALTFREDVEGAVEESASPDEPAAVLRALVEATGDRASALEASAGDVEDPDRRERLRAFAAGVREDAATVADRLAGAEFGTFGVVSAALDLGYSRMLAEARRLADGREELPASVADDLDDLDDVLALFGEAREHFKTLYFQWELIDLSRALLYASVPALVVTSAAVLYLDPGAVAGRTLGLDNLVWTVSLAATVAVLPFLTLLAVVLRVATVAKRTLSVGPFVLQETGPGGERPGDGG